MASTPETVARIKPIRDRIAGIVRNFGSNCHRAQPQISIIGDPRKPKAKAIQRITWVNVLMSDAPNAFYADRVRASC